MPRGDDPIEFSDLARLTCQPVSKPIGAGPEPARVLAALADDPTVCCLWGDWAQDSVLIFRQPLITAAGDGVVLGQQPALTDAAPEVVGGGWVGHLGYDRAVGWLRFYDNLLRWRDGQWTFEALWSAERADDLAAVEAQWTQLLVSATSTLSMPDYRVGRFGGRPPSAHLRGVEQAIGRIRAGELYQVNVCTRLSAAFAGAPLGLFTDLMTGLGPAFGAYLGGDRPVASASPELFLRRRGRHVLTEPIKGTLPRAGADGNDAALRRSVKDRAENVMIVDLMRNDLGQVSRTGSVRVRTLLDVTPHPGVWHLVSAVAGELRDDVTDADLLTATFPPGSVTGAPKIAAMQAIAEIESERRGAYTGAIGFASPSWGLEFSVAIRTFEIAGDTIQLGVGGGVTADSVPMAEWRECLDKAAPLLGGVHTDLVDGLRLPVPRPTAAQLAVGCLETILAQDGRVLRLADHLARLDRSVRELYGRGLPDDLAARVLKAAAGPGRMVVRAFANGGPVRVTSAPLGPRPVSSSVCTVVRAEGLWRHKWADRATFEAIEQSVGPQAPLFVAVDGTVLETSRGNVFLLMADGGLRTAPLSDDVLPGVTRRAVLDLALDRGRPVRLDAFTVADLRAATACFWTSSLSGLVPITDVDGLAVGQAPELIAELDDSLGFWRRL